jgi:hypothetical protein
MTSRPFNNDSTPDERREVLQNDRDLLPKTTFSTFAEAFADEERGGRFKTDRPTQIIGSAPVPNYPGAGQEDPCGMEPPLGLDLSAAPIVGEAHEVRASIERLQKKPEDDPEAA